jgi:hypothetical protein
VLLILLVLVITIGARWLEGRDTDVVRVADAGANVVRG